MIVTFTDYGLHSPYLGQVEAAILARARSARVINLFSNLPRNDPKSAAYLLAAYCGDFPENSIFFCVVDPGVGSFSDPPVMLNLDGRWFVGPDNGLFDIVARQAKELSCLEIRWRPDRLSGSFHGRDLYAPCCAMLESGQTPLAEETDWKDRHDWPDDLCQVIYIDPFGNCISGIRAGVIEDGACVQLAGRKIEQARVFSDVDAGTPFWYENANGLVEIAVNMGDAARLLGLETGTKLEFC